MEYCILLSEIVKMQNSNCFIQYLQVHALVYVSLFPYISPLPWWQQGWLQDWPVSYGFVCLKVTSDNECPSHFVICCPSLYYSRTNPSLRQTDFLPFCILRIYLILYHRIDLEDYILPFLHWQVQNLLRLRWSQDIYLSRFNRILWESRIQKNLYITY